MMPPQIQDYAYRRRDPAWERDLVRQLRQEPEEFRLQFIHDFLDSNTGLALLLAHKCLTERASFESLLSRGLRQADASDIRFWLECVAPRLGFRRLIWCLNHSEPELQGGVAKAHYWLNLFADLPGYDATAIEALAH